MDVLYKFHVTEEEEPIYFMSKYYIHRVPMPLTLKQTSHFSHFIKERQRRYKLSSASS